MRISDWSSDVCSSDLVSVAALNLLYQFWVHTQHIPKLGWLEWCFVTPSNHRAHHAQNPLYMDRNYGGVFIIWDRLFRTFQEEDDNEPVIFGVTTPLASWNPLWANLQFYARLWADARRAGHWRSEEQTSELQSLMRISFAVF